MKYRHREQHVPTPAIESSVIESAMNESSMNESWMIEPGARECRPIKSRLIALRPPKSRANVTATIESGASARRTRESKRVVSRLYSFWLLKSSTSESEMNEPWMIELTTIESTKSAWRIKKGAPAWDPEPPKAAFL